MNSVSRSMQVQTGVVGFAGSYHCLVAWISCYSTSPTSGPCCPSSVATRRKGLHVGRVYLNPNTGQAVWAGYIVHINGINSSLFNGSPSEATAYFTFSTDVLSLTPMPNNGDMALSLVSAGTFNVYYNSSPSGDWSNPASFTSGQLIATFTRKESLFPELGTVGFHSLSENLV